ncbi:hypothetical protein KR059_006371 [Drosophila kikkawai]|nr:hypothetical protein KR059_006371 [Drosophila kikkawai]
MQSKGSAVVSALLKPFRTLLCQRDMGSYPSLPARKDLKKMKVPDPAKMYDSCWQAMRRTEFKCRSDPEFNMPSFIDSRKACLNDPCATEIQGMDVTHYKPQDMFRRKYSRTWNECVVKRRKCKVQCVPVEPKIPRRSRKVHKKNACTENLCVLGKQDIKLKSCKLMKPSLCPRFKMPNCCVDVRDPPKCTPGKRGGRCKKRNTKYPSYSECRQEPVPHVPPVECKCTVTPSICEMWRFYRTKV